MAAAHVNRVAVVCCDRSGLERGQEWNEASCAIDQDGWVVATAENGVVLADLNLERSRNKQVTDLVDAFGDRRPELYGVVTEAKAAIEAGEFVAN